MNWDQSRAMLERSRRSLAGGVSSPFRAKAPVPLFVLRYGLLGLPLAFAALPIYVHVPKLYAEQAGLSLALVGTILLLTRIVDALSDPLIGWVSDRFLSRRGLVALALPLLAVGLGGLLAPPPARAACGWPACWWW